MSKQQGDELFNNGCYDRAIDVYTQIVNSARDEEQAAIFSNRAACHAKLEKWPDSLYDAERCILASASFATGYYRAVVACLKLGDIAAARRYLNLDNFPQLHYNHYETQIEKQEGDAVQQKNIGDESFRRRDYQAAVDNYSAYIKLDMNNKLVFSNRCAAYLKLSAWSEALQDAERCIRLDKSFGKAHLRAAYSCCKLRRIADASCYVSSGLDSIGTKEDLQSIKLDLSTELKQYADEQLNLGKELDVIPKLYTDCIQLNDSIDFQLKCYSNRCLSYLNSARPDECIEDCNFILAHSLSPSDLKRKVTFRLCKALCANASFEKAKDVLRKFIASNLEDTEALRVFSDITQNKVKSRTEQEVLACMPSTLVPFLRSLFDKVREVKTRSKGISKSTLRTRSLSCSDEERECVAYISIAVHLIHGYYLRPVQLAALALFIKKPADRAILLQIATGQGKTVIVNAWAIFCCLRFRRVVNVVTSHQSLAIRETKGNSRELFGLFGLTVSHNTQEDVTQVGPRDCYTANIVFGTASDFIFDILKTEYLGQKTLNGRKIEDSICIGDEIDDMFMDKSSDTCRLAQYAVGLSDINLAIIKLQFLVSNVELVPTDKLPFSDKRTSRWRYFSKSSDPISWDELCDLIRSDMTSFLNINSSCATNMSIGDKALDRNTLLSLTPYAAAYGIAHMQKYIESAIEARFKMRENVEYVVRDGKIVIQDLGTGESRENSSWSNGLHQFLEIKHGLEMSKETLMTNLMTSRAFFRRFRCNLYGLSGTLGNSKDRLLLEDVYKADCVDIATDKPVARLYYPVRFCTNSDHLVFMAAAVKREVTRNRAVLIIAENIHKARIISQHLKSNGMLVKEMLKKEDVELGSKMAPKYIIVSTNLLGRGADIEINDTVANNGGLHVIVAYPPANLRILYQAYGRAARKGLPGSCELIFTHHSILMNSSMDQMKFEEVHFSDLDPRPEFNKQMILQDAQEMAFSEYCKLLTAHRSTLPMMFDAKTGVLNTENPMFKTCEENWARFLRLHADSPDNLKNRFDKDVTKFFDRLVQEGANLIKNPGLLVRRGNEDGNLENYRAALVIDPRHFIAATRIVTTQLNRNNWDQSPVHSKEVILRDIDEAIKSNVAYIQRLQCVETVQESFSSDYSNQRNGADAFNRTAPSAATADEGHAPPPPAFTASFASFTAPAAGTSRPASSGSSSVPVATASSRPSSGTAGTSSIASGSASTSNGNDPSSTMHARVNLKTAYDNLDGLNKLKAAIESVADIRSLGANFDSTTDSEALQEGHGGAPKPQERPKPPPKKKGSWWTIIVGAIFCCVGLCFLATAALGSFAMLASCAAIVSGAQDIIIGIRSIASGIPIDLGDWACKKLSFVSDVVGSWLNQTSPRTQQAMKTIRDIQTRPPLFGDDVMNNLKTKVNRMSDQAKQRFVDRDKWDEVLLTMKPSLSALFTFKKNQKIQDFHALTRIMALILYNIPAEQLPIVRSYVYSFFAKVLKWECDAEKWIGDGRRSPLAVATNLSTTLSGCSDLVKQFKNFLGDSLFGKVWNITVERYNNDKTYAASFPISLTPEVFQANATRLSAANCFEDDGFTIKPSVTVSADLSDVLITMKKILSADVLDSNSVFNGHLEKARDFWIDEIILPILANHGMEEIEKKLQQEFRY